MRNALFDDLFSAMLMAANVDGGAGDPPADPPAEGAVKTDETADAPNEDDEADAANDDAGDNKDNIKSWE